ncbi:MAG TPA: hypothetical protein PK152_05000 [Anaerolineales bacterium]|nr:hypothetical protein [Anaerolineae bacterium]HRJ57650.1 hypothetical protein [Anaerolineales bacterium]HRK88469.1 hypothetical protein [Anaerolineales bacterium]
MKTKIPPLYAVPIVLLAAALIYFIRDFSYGVYYDPLCERHAEENGWQYVSFKPPWRSPGACKFETPDGRSVRLEDWEMLKTSGDHARWAVGVVLIWPLWLAVMVAATFLIKGLQRILQG